ncbi:MAG: hypothetical protein U5K43_01185 [Halofilum sp. (in: g-proteobacteria)]|nr:hypothetical protein [Halofilum sp. (in: g-proteobacteria)]
MPERDTIGRGPLALALGGAVLMLAMLAYGLAQGYFLAEGSAIASVTWGQVLLVDLYVGFALFGGLDRLARGRAAGTRGRVDRRPAAARQPRRLRLRAARLARQRRRRARLLARPPGLSAAPRSTAAAAGARRSGRRARMAMARPAVTPTPSSRGRRSNVIASPSRPPAGGPNWG